MDGFKRSVYVSVGVILGSFLVFLGAIWFVGSLIQQSGIKLVDHFSNYFHQSYAAERLLSLKQLEPQARDLERKMDILLPVQDQLLNFPDFMKNLANAHVVTLSLYYPGNIVPPNGGAGSVSFSLNASGPLSSLQGFLDALENKTRQFWVGVDSVDFVRSDSNYALTAQGKVFFRAN